MTTADVFGRIVSLLERSAIPYMLTGSFASSYHGAPRATQDIDIVIAPTPDQLATLVRLFPDADYYVNVHAALQALHDETQFNVVDIATGWKVDFIIRRTRAFSRTEFERRQLIELDRLQLYVATVEDLIIAKMEWAKRGQSARQIEDVAGILKLRFPELDRAYVERWVRELELGQQWEDARERAGIN